MANRTTLAVLIAGAFLVTASHLEAKPPKAESGGLFSVSTARNLSLPASGVMYGVLPFMDSMSLEVIGGAALPIEPESAVDGGTAPLHEPRVVFLTPEAPVRDGAASLLGMEDCAWEDPPLEGKDREIQILPSLVTFFCNPYSFGTDLDDGESLGLRSDTVREVNLGIMGELDEKVRIAFFSTFSMFHLLDKTPFVDRESFIQDRMTHRFSFLLSFSPAPHMYLGAAGGAEIIDSPRAYILELLFEARLRF